MESRGHIHFLGIAGHAMRCIAGEVQAMGYRITGCDESAVPPGSTWLDEHGIDWWREPRPEKLEGVEKIVISGGTPPTHPEVLWAREHNVPIVSFAQLVGELVASERRLVISGTHGKTTTTAMVAWILQSAGKQPDYVIGILPLNFESSAHLRGGKVVVIEGDEYASSQLEPTSKFHYYKPDSLIVTEVELDHPDIFPDLEAIKVRFRELIAGLPADGRLIWWHPGRVLTELVKEAPCETVSYSLNSGDYQAKNVEYLPTGISFDVVHNDQVVGRVQTKLYGAHNVENTLGAIVMALGEGLTIEQIQSGLASFLGTSRRFEIVSAPEANITVVDDYAHHPTAVAAVIEAARAHFPGRRLVTIFRPHTYSRTIALLSEYQQCFAHADIAYVTDIEGAREAHLEAKVSGEDIVKGAAGNVSYQSDREALIAQVVAEARPGDIIVNMSVGTYGDIAKELNAKLNK